MVRTIGSFSPSANKCKNCCIICFTVTLRPIVDITIDIQKEYRIELKEIVCLSITSEYFPTKDMQTPLAAPPLLSFDPVLTDDAQCAETNETPIFRVIGYKKNWSTKMTKNNHNLKNINGKNQKFDFSINSIDSTSFM